MDCIAKILITDDYPSFRRGVREYLLGALPGTSLEKASNPEEMMRLVQRTQFNMITMDITMPGWSPLQVTNAIQKTMLLHTHSYLDDAFGTRVRSTDAKGGRARISQQERVLRLEKS